MNGFVFKKITVEGVDISKFSLYVDGDKSTNLMGWESVKSVAYAENLSKLIERKLVGVNVPVAETMGEGHYIVFSAHSLDVNRYDIKVENGNIYITGSYLSIDNAYNEFLSDVLGYNFEDEDANELQRELDITAADSKVGDLGLGVPYNREQLVKLFEEANERDDMIISGTHVFGDVGNSFEVQYVRERMEKSAGKCCCLLEVDLGQYSKYCPHNKGVDTLSDYDLSRIVSECYKFVCDGGIISTCIHMANPLMNAPDGSWYRGNIGGNANANEMFTEGTELHEKFLETLAPMLRFLRGLRDLGVPFLFRPLHEINGDWFWWCYRQRDGGEVLTQETMHNFWKCFYKILNDDNGMKDLSVWVYAPSPMFDNLHCYAGDEYVDIVGVDWYTGLHPKYPDVPHPYGWGMSRNKPMALAEVGTGEDQRHFYDAIQLLDFMKDIMQKGCKISYFSTWTFDGSIAIMDKNKEFMENEIILSLDDLAKRWARDSANK